MNTFFSRLIRQGGIYALGNLAVKLGGLILAPLLLNPELLPQAAFGHLILLEAAWQILVAVVGLGVGHGMLKHMADSPSESGGSEIPFTSFVAMCVAAGVCLVVMVLLARPLAAFLLDDAGASHIVLLSSVYIAVKVIGGIPLVMLRFQERAGLFTTAIILEMVLLIAGAYYLLVVQERGLLGVVEAYVLSAGTGSLVLCAGMLMRVRWRLKSSLVPKLLRFGIPVALAGLAAIVLNVGDRYLLKWLTDAEVVAVYGWAAKLSSVLNMLFVHSFQLAFLVIGLKALTNDEEGRSLYRRTFRHYVIWTGWAVTGLALLSYDFTRLLTDAESYLAAESMVLPISLGFMAYGVYFIIVNSIYASGKSRYIAYAILAATALNIFLNVVLIPVLGGMGAAVATLVSYVVLMWLTAWLAYDDFPVRYPWELLASVTLIIVSLYLVARPSLFWEDWPRILWRLFLIGLYPAVILGLRLYRPAEIAELIRLVRSGIGSRK